MKQVTTTSRGRYHVFLSAVSTVVALLLLTVSSAFAQEEPAVVENQVYVKIAESARAQFNLGPNNTMPKSLSNAITGITAVDNVAQEYGAQRMERVFRPAGKHEPRHVEWGLDRWYVVQYQADVAPKTVAQSYLNAAGIESSSPVYEKALHVLDKTPMQRANDEGPDAIPNDPRYSDQWHYDNTGQTGGTPDADINLPEAHDIETGSSEVIISVLDSGLDLDHPDFEGMLWINDAEDINNNGTFEPFPESEGGDLNGVDDDNNGFVDDVVGYDHADNDPVPEGTDSHGTHVAGTVAAKNGNGQFGAGVAGGDGSAGSGVRLMITQTFSNSVGGFAEGIVYAADNGAIVSQNSWGYTAAGVFDQPVLDAIDYFRANAGGPNAPMNGGLFINSAGNSDSDGQWYPGFYPPSTAVSATEDTDTKASYSNFGDWIDIAAPGGQFGEDGVWSTVIGGFGSLSGTSMAAPHVSGVIGLVASANPGLTDEQMETLLINTGKDISDNQPQRMGPRLDAFAALQASGDDDTPPATITDLATVGVSGNDVDLEWTAPGDDGTTGTANSYDIRWSADGPIDDSSDFDAANQVQGEPSPSEPGTVETFTVGALPFGTEVYFAIRAADEVGNFSDLSNSPSATTDPGPQISVTPESFSVSLETGDSTNQDLTISNIGDPGAGPLNFSTRIGSGSGAPTTPSQVAAPASGGSGNASAFAAATDPSGGDGPAIGPTQTTYQLDDGSSENALGLTNGGDFMWLNAFQVVEGAGTLNEISSTFGWTGGSGLPAGKEVTYLVYEDPNDDGNPSDAELLTQTTTEVQDPHTDTFVSTSIDPTPVEGTFFIAVLYEGQAGDQFPAPMDESSEFQGASWAVGSTTGDFNINDLSAPENDVGPDNLGDIGFPANWMLRAEGSSGFLAVSPTEGSISQGQSQTLTASFNASDLEPGTFEASILIDSNDPAQPTTNVPATLEVTAGPPDIVADPSAIDYGGVLLGNASTQTITLTNTGGTELEVTNINLTNSDYTLADPNDIGGFILPFGESRDVEVEFAPSATGPSSGEFLATTAQGVSALVSLDGEGLPAPTLAFAPDTLEQTITVGDTSSTPLTISNEGMAGSTLDFSFPFFASMDLMNDPNVPKNNTSSVIDDPGYEKGEGDPHAGIGHPVVTGAGGPDEFGYRWIDSNEQGGPDFAFTDISGEGTPLSLGDDDGETVSLPFQFEFYGEVKTDVTVSSNGYLTFGEDGTDFGNDEIPDTTPPNDGIFVFWDDLDPSDGGEIYTYHDTANNRFIVQYDDVPAFSTGGPFTFQVILTPDGAIRYNFLEIDEEDNDSATTGIENAAGDVGLQVAFNTPYPQDSLSVSIVPAVEFVTDVEPASGSVADGESTDLSVTFDASGFEPGEYEQFPPVVLTSNDPATPQTTTPAVMNVEAGAPSIALEPDSVDHGSLLIGNSNSRTFTIVNDGSAPLEVESVSSTNGDFTLVNSDDTGPFTVPLFGSRNIEVAFAPSSVGDLSAEIEIVNNATDTSATAVGEGLPAPTLAFAPDTLETTLNPGDSTDVPLTISNDGMSGSTLEYSFPGFAAMDLMNDPNVPKNDTSSVIDDPSYQRNEADGGGDPHAGIGNPVVTGAGGPDGFGYTWIDSNEENGPSFQFMDISDEGTQITITDDFGSAPSPEVDLPFAFEFYGEEKTTVRIDNNGFLHFDSPSGNYFGNDEIPDTDDPNGVVAAFWDDLNPDAGGAVYTYHDEQNDRFIVQFDEVPHFVSTGSNTFQIILNEDGSIQYQFLNVDADSADDFPGESATAGIEDATGETGLQIAFNPSEQYHEDSLSVAIQPPVNFITDVEPTSGTLGAGESEDVSVTFDASEIVPGEFAQVPPVVLTSNDPTNTETTVPAILNVEGGPPTIAVEPDSLNYGDVLVGGDSTQTFTIINDGDGPLNVQSVSTTSGQFMLANDEDSGPFTIPLFESRDIEVVFAPTTTGAKEAQVVVQTDAENDLIATVDVFGEGLPAPELGVDPMSLSEMLRLNATSEQSLTVSNTGDAPLNFSVGIGTQMNGSALDPGDVAGPSASNGSGDGSGLQTATEPYDGDPTSPTPSESVYQVDDGSTENGLGLTNGGDFMWLNAFQVVEGAGTITQISSTFGWTGGSGIPEGKEVTYLVYEDPNDDGNPNDAVLLTEVDAEVQDPHTDTFVEVGVPPTDVEGTFFIAALYPEHAAGTFPAPMDESSTFQGVSWAVGNTTPGAFNKDDLTANDVGPDNMGDIGFPANWLLRADGGAGSTFVSVSPTSGTVAQGESQTLTATFDSEGLEPGTFETTIGITSNDPTQDTTGVTATLEVFDACPTAWELQLTTLDSSSQGDTLTLGQGPFATGGLDNEFVGPPTQPGEAECGEVEQPPIPPTTDFRFVDTGLPDVNLGQGTRVDIRPDTGSTGVPQPDQASSAPAHWRVNLQTENYPVSMSWDNTVLQDALPARTVRLVDAATGGNLVEIDMKETDSTSIANTSVGAVEVRVGGDSHEMVLVDGWNLKSMPVFLPNMAFGTVVTACESAFRFDPSDGYSSLAPGDDLILGRGYFMNCNADTIEVTGAPSASKRADVSDGWNIIGAFDEEISASSVTAGSGVTIETSIFGFDPTQGYSVAETLVPTEGYWVKVSGSGTLDLSGSGGGSTAAVAAKSSSTDAGSSTGTTRLVLTDAEGRSATLHLARGASEAEMKKHALPPKPPSEIFDVRFDNGRSAVSVATKDQEASTDAFHALELQAVSYPVTLRLEGAAEGDGLQVKQGAGAGGVDARLTTQNPSVTLSASNGPVKVGLHTIPAEFALQKSYPNPTRQRATIEFALPEEADVTLEVYDVLGRRVAQLVDGRKRAGQHSIEFDATRLPSGTYFYRMRAGDFTETRRMVVVR
jgi:hypothetical protein